MIILFLMTPLFGSLKNYVKYKQFDFFNFIRTPLIYLLLQCFLRTYNYWKFGLCADGLRLPAPSKYIFKSPRTSGSDQW